MWFIRGFKDKKIMSFDHRQVPNPPHVLPLVKFYLFQVLSRFSRIFWNGGLAQISHYFASITLLLCEHVILTPWAWYASSISWIHVEWLMIVFDSILHAYHTWFDHETHLESEFLIDIYLVLETKFGPILCTFFSLFHLQNSMLPIEYLPSFLHWWLHP